MHKTNQATQALKSILFNCIYDYIYIYAMYTYSCFKFKHLTAALFSEIFWIYCYLALHIHITFPCLLAREREREYISGQDRVTDIITVWNIFVRKLVEIQSVPFPEAQNIKGLRERSRCTKHIRGQWTRSTPWINH